MRVWDKRSVQVSSLTAVLYIQSFVRRQRRVRSYNNHCIYFGIFNNCSSSSKNIQYMLLCAVMWLMFSHGLIYRMR